MKNEIISIAKKSLADKIGFASYKSFDKNDAIFKIYPNVKTVICIAFRVLRGIYRGAYEGTTYYQYTTMGVENMEETIMPDASIKIANFLESKGYIGIPQRRNQQIMAEQDSTNPEVAYDAIYRNKPQENQMNFVDAAVKCGIGEKGLSGALLTKEFGPMVRYCFVLTDAEIEPDVLENTSLCDKCGKCVNACPGKAISNDGKLDAWQCAVYYNGANGTKNPFMPYDAFAELEDRIDIIAGNAKVTPERAREILDKIVFYPPAHHSYPCSICGRACDVACYVHLEEKGVLTKKFNKPFKTREEWKFDINDFKK